MNKDTMMDAIGMLPESMLEEAAQLRQKPRQRRYRYPLAAAAACLCLLLSLPLALGSMQAGTKAENEAPAEMADGKPAENLPVADRYYSKYDSSAEGYGGLTVQSSAHFLATVISAEEGHLLVEPLVEAWEHSSADRIVVPIPSPEDPQEFAPGDLVRITYSGTLLESYPAQAVNVTQIERLG